jgi:hypothetical protein
MPTVPPFGKGGQGGFFIAGGETTFWFMDVKLAHAFACGYSGKSPKIFMT